jgi:hypothetical protein
VLLEPIFFSFHHQFILLGFARLIAGCGTISLGVVGFELKFAPTKFVCIPKYYSGGFSPGQGSQPRETPSTNPMRILIENSSGILDAQL